MNQGGTTSVSEVVNGHCKVDNVEGADGQPIDAAAAVKAASMGRGGKNG